MGRFTITYQDSTANLKAGTICSFEDINRYPQIGAGIGGVASDSGSLKELNLCYFSETFSTSDSDFYEKFQFHLQVFSASNSVTGVWQVDLGYPETGSYEVWESGVFNVISGANTAIKVNSSVAPLVSPSRIPPEYNTYTYFRLSVKTGVLSTGTLSLSGVRIYNGKFENFCPKDNHCHILSSSAVPSTSFSLRNSSLGLLGDGAIDELSTAVSGTSTNISGVEPGLTIYLDCRRSLQLDKLTMIAHAKDKLEYAIAGSHDGQQFTSNTVFIPTTTRNLYTKYETTLSLGKYRYYRIYVVDRDTGQPSRQVSVTDLRLFRDRGLGDYQEVYYSRYALDRTRTK